MRVVWTCIIAMLGIFGESISNAAWPHAAFSFPSASARVPWAYCFGAVIYPLSVYPSQNPCHTLPHAVEFPIRQANFRRAFKRWEGVAPQAAREGLRSRLLPNA